MAKAQRTGIPGLEADITWTPEASLAAYISMSVGTIGDQVAELTIGSCPSLGVSEQVASVPAGTSVEQVSPAVVTKV